MQSILEEFAYGNITPEALYFKRNSEYGQAMRAVSSNEEKLLAKLGLLMTAEAFMTSGDLVAGEGEF